jgi:hypothetical protein
MKQIHGNYSASNIFMKRGVELDLEKNCFSVSNKLFSFIPLPSHCESIPKPDYVLIFKTLYAKCEACELEDFDSGNGSVYQLSLVYNKNRRLIVDEGKNKTDIFHKAKMLAEHFHLKIKDSASNRKQPVWL